MVLLVHASYMWLCKLLLVTIPASVRSAVADVWTVVRFTSHGRGLLMHRCHLWCITIVKFSSIGSRPSDHYFRSVCLFVCAEFFLAVFDPISLKLGHMLYVWV